MGRRRKVFSSSSAGFKFKVRAGPAGVWCGDLTSLLKGVASVDIYSKGRAPDSFIAPRFAGSGLS